MTEVRWSKTARADLRGVYEFIARDSAPYALRMMERFDQAVDSLTTFPEAGALVVEWDRQDLREVYVASYRVIYQYTADADLVEILAIFHSARQLPDVDSLGSQ
jgi:plasmid stabilization system protein ParE